MERRAEVPARRRLRPAEAEDDVLLLCSLREKIGDYRAHLKLHIPHVVSLDS
jgi:hypothetical protein